MAERQRFAVHVVCEHRQVRRSVCSDIDLNSWDLRSVDLSIGTSRLAFLQR
jgi:hypothetical protein